MDTLLLEPDLSLQEVPGVIPNVLRWTKDALVSSNPWDILDRVLANTDAPAVDRALVLILEDTRRLGETIPQTRPLLLEVEARIIQRARQALDRALEPDLEHGSRRGKRPADVYRAFASPLRWMLYRKVPSQLGALATMTGADPVKYTVDRGYSPAGELLRDLSECQSLPMPELECPDWIDGYTGEVDASWILEGLQIPDAIRLPREEEDFLRGAGYTQAMVDQFFAAQEGFNAEDGLDEEHFERLLNDIEPQFMEMQKDVAPTERLPELRAGFQSLLDQAREYQSQLRRFYEQTTPPDRKKRWRYITRQVREDFRISQEAGAVVDHLNELALAGEAPADIAVLFLALQNAFGFDYTDARRVRLTGRSRTFTDSLVQQVDDKLLLLQLGREKIQYDPASEEFRSDTGTLKDWMDLNVDELLEALGDRGTRITETDMRVLEEFDRETFRLLVASGGTDPKQIYSHQGFLEGFFRAALSLREIGSSTGDGWRNRALEAGWESYREAVSPEGNRAFHAALNAGRSMKEAMKAFWRCQNLEEKRAAESKIASISPSGLVLSNGRKVDWRIAALKLQQNELDLPQEERVKLRDLLTSKGWGTQFANSL